MNTIAVLQGSVNSIFIHSAILNNQIDAHEELFSLSEASILVPYRERYGGRRHVQNCCHSLIYIMYFLEDIVHTNENGKPELGIT